MYDILLFVHSWFRWLVLIAGLQLIYQMYSGWITKRTWSPDNVRSVSLFNEVLSYQVGMGILLYCFMSPLPRAGWIDFAFTMKNPVLRFWTLEHAVSMLIAISSYQIGKFYSLKKAAVENKFKAMSITITFSMFAILIGIPWPFLKHGRNLFRLFF